MAFFPLKGREQEVGPPLVPEETVKLGLVVLWGGAKEGSRIGFSLGGRARVAVGVVAYSDLGGWAEFLFWGDWAESHCAFLPACGAGPRGS